MTAKDAYATAKQRFHRLAAIEDAGGVLHWDMAVMMPPGAAKRRAEQIATLKRLAHEALTAPDLGDALERAGGARLGDWDAANLAEMRRVRTHALAAPADLIEALSKAGMACEMIWREARPANDFAAIQPALEEVLRLTRAMAAAKGAALGLSPYDALLDQYEPGGRAVQIDAHFEILGAELPPLIDAILAAQAADPAPARPAGPFAIAAQKAVGARFMAAAGFDFARGRLDVSLHPFCGGATDDVRLTTRYDEAEFASALMGVLHETGHALYELGLPEDWRGQPVGAARGMVLHESQSLLIEMQACRSAPFFRWAAPVLREAFGGAADDPAWTAKALHRHALGVERGLIRVDADEATYPLHVILRYRLERAMIAGDLAIPDLPGAWNDGFAALFGFPPPDDRRGCLQDIHWFDGAFGYFPTYTLGAMAAAQLYAAALKAVPGIPDALAEGDFAPLLGWLRTHVHGRASLTDTDATLNAATGSPLDVKPFLTHLRTRYGV